MCGCGGVGIILHCVNSIPSREKSKYRKTPPQHHKWNSKHFITSNIVKLMKCFVVGLESCSALQAYSSPGCRLVPLGVEVCSASYIDGG